MKFTVVFLLAACLQVKAVTYAQNVSLSVRNASLEQVLGELRKQTGYNFFYNDAMIRTGKPVTVDIKAMPLEDALKACLSNQSLSFSIVNKTVVLKDKSLQPNFLAVPPPPEEFRGRVEDSLRMPLVGATVRVKGTKIVTVTDQYGMFSLKDVDDNQTLVISYTGYITIETPVRKPGASSRQYSFTLKRSNNPLDEVQVIAYGTSTRRYNIGNVTTVSAEDIRTSGAYNIVNALDGRVPGLAISVSSGMPGARATMQVRGQNTLKASLTAGGTFDQPLIIVDGVPFAAQNNDITLFLNTFTAGTGGMSSLNGLNPADIASVSVLKDADATSIYGSQGANGVIVITTKRGKPGTNTFNINIKTGPTKTTRRFDMMDTQDYLAIRHQAILSDGITDLQQDATSFPDLLAYDTTKYTDWAKKYFGGTANTTDAHLSMSGGTNNAIYLVSGGYTKATYNFPGDFNDQRYTMHSSIGTHSNDNRFRMDFGSDFSYDNNNSINNPGLGSAMMLAPDFPDMMDSKGNLVWNYKGADLSSYQMLGYLKQPYDLQNFNMNNYLRLSYQLFKGLTLTANAGYNLGMSKQFSSQPLASQAPGPNAISMANFGRSDAQTLNIEPQVDYKKIIGKGTLSVLVGGTYKKSTASSDYQTGSDYVDDALLGTITAATTVTAYDSYNIYKYVGGFGRIGYVWDDKYIVNLTGRRDGSSNFGPGHRWGTFGSAGLGWIVSEEGFFQNLRSVMSFLKLSANYGTNGSDGNAPYNFQPYWKVPLTSITAPFDGIRSFSPNNLYNPDYSWASKRSVNFNIDMGFLNDKLIMGVGYYLNRTGNQITSYTLPAQTGFTSVIQNMNATLQNTGLEFTLTSRNITHKNFSWVTSFNISGNRNKLVAFPGLATSPYASLYTIGKSTSTVWGLKYAGVNDTTGLYQYYNAKGDKVYQPKSSAITSGGDVQPLLDTRPDFFGGINNVFTYKRLSLAFFFKFQKGMAYNYLKGINYGTPNPGGQENLPEILKGQFWTKPGDHKTLQRLTTDSYAVTDPNARIAQRYGYYFGSSDAVYSDDTYLRLKSLSLSYNLPEQVLRKYHMKGLSFTLQAQNLFTITNYKFGDPETPGVLYTVPQQLMISGGVSIDL